MTLHAKRCHPVAYTKWRQASTVALYFIVEIVNRTDRYSFRIVLEGTLKKMFRMLQKSQMFTHQAWVIIRGLSFHRMNHRQIIGISGVTATEFLQGLITNDMNLLASSSTKKNPFLYSLFLNAKGRTLTDTFIYSLPACSSQNHSYYLIECDSQVRDQLLKLLIVYNLRKQVEIWKADDIDVWSALPDHPSHLLTEKKSWSEKEVSSDKLLFYAADPRAVPGWSGRMLLQAGSDRNKKTDR
uniref:Putative transferase caf17 n=1 Tax=Schistocephalus solidus TaxID=70667 RepID=A0A0X3PED9_SCHSO